MYDAEQEIPLKVPSCQPLDSLAIRKGEETRAKEAPKVSKNIDRLELASSLGGFRGQESQCTLSQHGQQVLKQH